MATVSAVALTQPTSDPNIDETQTFTMGGQITKALHGGLDYDMHWQYDQDGLLGLGLPWVDIPASSGGLTTADTNPQTSLGTEAEVTITVTGATAGSYNIRIHVVDNNDGGTTYDSSTQAVTVNAASGVRRAFAIS